MSEQPKERSRSRSPKRELPKKESKFENLVVSWLGEKFRSPRTPFKVIRWSQWDKHLESFCEMEYYKRNDSTDGTMPLTVARSLIFFMQHSKQHEYGREELQFLAHHLCCPDEEHTEFVNEFKREITELLIFHECSTELFWVVLEFHQRRKIPFIVEKGTRFELRYQNPTKDAQFEQEFYDRNLVKVKTNQALADRLELNQYVRLSRGDKDKTESKRAMNLLNSFILLLLPNLSSGGTFAFPTLDGKNNLFDSLEEENKLRAKRTKRPLKLDSKTKSIL